MTPIIGLLVAVLAGFLAPSRRGVLAGVIPPMLAVTAAQSWYLGTGRGHNPPATTTGSPAYWVVQLIILALICGVALGIHAVLARRATRRAESSTSIPPPDPKSSTTSPGLSFASAVGFPQPNDASIASSGICPACTES